MFFKGDWLDCTFDAEGVCAKKEHTKEVW